MFQVVLLSLVNSRSRRIPLGAIDSGSGAAAPKHAEHLYERFCVYLADEGVPVETGSFGAEMAVHIDNDGPVTIWLDSEAP